MNTKNMRRLMIMGLISFSAQTHAGVLLATAGDFAILAGAAVTNTGPSVIDGAVTLDANNITASIPESATMFF